MNRIESLTEKRIKEWYSKHVDPKQFDKRVVQAEKEGYVLDRKSGLLTREPDEDEKKHGITIRHEMFPRPTDLHYHEDVGEIFKFINGSGYIHIAGVEQPIRLGDRIFIPAGVQHSLMPDKGSILEIKLECTGILDEKKEIWVENFDKFGPWLKHYKDIHDIIEEQIGRYKTVIKPLIEEDNRFEAIQEMGNIVFELEKNRTELGKLHMGVDYFAAAHGIHTVLLDNRTPGPDILEMFEASAAQTKLPKGRYKINL